MLRGLSRVALAAAVVLALTCEPAAATTIPNHGYFNSNGLYDCQVFQAALGNFGYYTYVNSYKFNSNGTYSEASARIGHKLQSPVTTGKYRLSGNKVIPSSGILKNLHEYVIIQTNNLHVARDDGHLSALNCMRIYPPPPTPPKVVALATYTCDVTGLDSSDPLQPPFYSSKLVTSTLTFFNNGTYQPNLLSAPGNYHVSGSQIVFTSGPYWTSGQFSAQHSIGILHSPGVKMPNATYPFDPNTLYTLVIKDTKQEGGDPPSREFVTTDGPTGSYSNPESFYYCNKS